MDEGELMNVCVEDGIQFKIKIKISVHIQANNLTRFRNAGEIALA
jgi:hypothetical protein